jgi:tetratricopeptide (TPR) repeat protein
MKAMIRSRWLLLATLVAVALALMPALALAAPAGSGSDLGDITFPNSGAAGAQPSFLRGVAALHSFWFDEAAEAFRNAQEIDPAFALAYWGEAMSYNHPLWAQQDIASARAVLERLGKTRKERLEKAGTERERMYMDAVETLYGEGDKLARDIAYEKMMGKIQARYPDDVEAAAFHALSILGTVRPGDKGFARQVKAGAVALKLFHEHPNHPGAAHYVIHSFDDPEHAILALPAAERYAEIAPEASHALHMPSHIFMQLGMWDRVAQSNLAAFRASEKWVAKKNLSIAKKDYHAFEWRAYANLQRGAWSEVKDALKVVADAAAKTKSAELQWYDTIMTARYFLTSGADDGRPLPDGTTPASRRNDASGAMLLVLGLNAAKAGNADRTDDAAKRLAKMSADQKAGGNDYQARWYQVMADELEGAGAMVRGRTDEALDHLSEAVSLEEQQDPPSGPADPVKPSHELYGELLARVGKDTEAVAQFQRSLERTPNRTDSLLGLARSSVKTGDMDTARQSYETLARYLKDADPGVPYLAEVRGFGSSTSTDGH